MYITPVLVFFLILQCLEINALENIFQSWTHESDAVFKLLKWAFLSDNNMIGIFIKSYDSCYCWTILSSVVNVRQQ